MLAVPAYVSTPTPPSTKHDGADFEPDDQWKRQLKKRIEDTFKSMIQDAKDNQQAQLRRGTVTEEQLDFEYRQAMNNIKGLAEEQYQLELMKERNERRWIAGAQMLPGWNDVLQEEQQNIMNSIKQSINSDNSARMASDNPTDEWATDGSPPPPPSTAAAAAYHESTPQSSDPHPPSTREAPTQKRPWSRTNSSSSALDRRKNDNNTRRSSSRDHEGRPPPPTPSTDQPTIREASTRERPWSQTSSSSSTHDRRRQDTNTQPTLSRDPEDHAPPAPAPAPPPSSTRRHKHERPTLSNIFPNTELTDEPEDLHRPSSGRPRANSEKPWDSSFGRSSSSLRSASSSDRNFGRSPPKNAHPVPEPRKSLTTSQDDPPIPKYALVRRGSAASIRSTGSGHSGKSIRQQPTTETIPERADDMEESPQERPRKSAMDKSPRDKDSRRGSRRDSHPSPVDVNIAMNRYENEPLSGLRTSSGPPSATMQYAMSPSSSFVEDRFHHPAERDRKPSSKSEVPYHPRESPYANMSSPSLVRLGPVPAPPPPPPRSSPYGGPGEDFIGPFPPFGRPPAGSNSPFGGDRDRDGLRDRERDRDRESLREREREYHPSISHKSSFSNFSNYEDRDGRRRERDWEAHWDEEASLRERDREYRDRETREREQWEWERDRERDLRERERDRDRDRELYGSRHREREYPHYSARPPGYPTPPSSASRGASSHVGVSEYLPMGDLYDEPPIPPSSARSGYGSYRPIPQQPPPPPPAVMQQDEWEYASRSSIPTRQVSYGRRDGERRGTVDGGSTEIDGYPSRPYAHVPATAGSVPISPPNGIDDAAAASAPPPAWQNWHAEGSRHRPPPSNNASDGWAAPTRPPQTNPSTSFSGPGGPPLQPPPPPPSSFSVHPNSVAPIAEDHQRRTERRASLNTYHGHGQAHANNVNVNRHSRDVEDRYAAAPFPPPGSAGTRGVFNEDEDFSADSGRSYSNSEEESGEDEQLERDEEGEEEEEEEEEDSDSDDDYKVRELEVEARRLELERREADAKIREQALELKRLKDEELRMEEEARKMEEDVKQKEEELRRKEEEAERMAETRRLAEEARRKEEDAARLADEARKKEEETKKKEREVKRREDDARKKAEDARKLRIETSKKAEETKRKEAEVKMKEEATRVKEEKLKEDEARNRELKEQAEQIAIEANKAKENLKKLEEETRRKELQIQEREAALLLREEELKRREADARKKEEDSRRKEVEEFRRKEEEAREAAKRREDEARAARAERDREREKTRREQEAQRQQQQQASERQFQDEVFIASLDPKLVEEQARLLQQAQFRKREEEIKRSRAEERKRQDSIGADSAWTPPSSFPAASSGTFASSPNSNHTNAYPSVSPTTFASGTSPTMPRSPPYNGPLNSDRSSGTSNWNTSNSAWSTTTKPTTIPSQSTARPNPSIPSFANKPRTGSVSSGTYPTGASPLGTSGFSESEWARRQAEFHNDQQEKFRREQEKKEAEIQMRSAGKPLSREEMGRVFENHERLWNRIAVPSTEQFTWSDIPWPMAKMPNSSEEISQPLIGAYIRSPAWPDKDGVKSTTKDRIKDSLKRWHPDRFDNRCLTRVIDSDKERVKLASGNVVRYLNELLRKENEAGNGLFGAD